MSDLDFSTFFLGCFLGQISLRKKKENKNWKCLRKQNTAWPFKLVDVYVYWHIVVQMVMHWKEGYLLPTKPNDKIPHIQKNGII